MDASEFLFPHDLAVTQTGIRKVLVIGSCAAHNYLDVFRTLAPEVAFDWILFNNPGELPAIDDATLQSYDFQYVLLSLRHIVRDEVVDFGSFLVDGAAEAVLARARQLLQLTLDSALQYNRTSRVPTFVGNFFVPQVPVTASLDQVGSVHDFTTIVRRLNEELAVLVRTYRNVYVTDLDSLGSSLGKRYFLEDVMGFYSHSNYWAPSWREFDTAESHNAPSSGRLDPLPRIEDVYPSRCDELVRTVWRQAECLYRTVNQIDMVKLVIFDLDDTLWRGQIAEHYGDGVPPPAVHGWVTGMWEAVQHLRARGIIVALCSKNDEALVRARWRRAVGAWLALDDFPIRKINWQPKAENVARIIELASVTARSTVFVDDNPVERESVKAALPAVRVLGANPYATRRILLWSAETQLAFRSAESAGREQSIRQLQVRESDRATLSREDFLNALGCSVAITKISSMDHPEFARAFELLNKTNQFNTTGARWTAAQMATFLSIHGRIFVFHVKDKYTDYGLVGTVLYRLGNFVQFAMSCRVLGLDVETSVVCALMRIMRAQDGPAFRAPVFKTEANMVCRDLFTRCGFVAERDGERSFYVRADAPIPAVAAHLTITTAVPDAADELAAAAA